MNCDEIQNDLPGWVCGSLPPEIQARIEAHLATCSRCQTERDALDRVCGLLRAVPMPVVRVDVPAIREEAARREQILLRRWRRVALIACSALAAVLLLGLCLTLEVKVERDQILVRWGNSDLQDQPNPLPVPPTPPTSAAADEQRIRTLQQLVQALALEVQANNLELERLKGQLDPRGRPLVDARAKDRRELDRSAIQSPNKKGTP